MGNQASQLGDGDGSQASKDLQFFDHTFKGTVRSCTGAFFRDSFGDKKNANIAVQIICKGQEAEIVEDEGIKSSVKVIVMYQFVSAMISVDFPHAPLFCVVYAQMAPFKF
jgi:hypothetical protein